MKKKFITGLMILITAVVCKAQTELGIYLNPVGGGYSQIQYNYNPGGQQEGQVIPLKGRGYNGASMGFVTLRFDRLRIGAEGLYIISGYRNFTNVTGIDEPEGTNWRHTFAGGGRIGFDIFQNENLAIAPTFALGTFRTRNDDFIEQPTERLYHKYSLFAEYKARERISIFAEPYFMNMRYIPAGTAYIGRMYNYNLSIGIGFRL